MKKLLLPLLLSCIAEKASSQHKVSRPESTSTQIGNASAKPFYENDSMEITLKLFPNQYKLKSGNLSKFRVIVSVKNISQKPIEIYDLDFHSYKLYQNQDYYMEAIDKTGNPIDITQKGDIDWIIDPQIYTINSGQVHSDTIETYIYQFSNIGTYKVRWVCDRANSHFRERTLQYFKTVYSNWATITIIK